MSRHPVTFVSRFVSFCLGTVPHYVPLCPTPAPHFVPLRPATLSALAVRVGDSRWRVLVERACQLNDRGLVQAILLSQPSCLRDCMNLPPGSSLDKGWACCIGIRLRTNILLFLSRSASVDSVAAQCSGLPDPTAVTRSSGGPASVVVVSGLCDRGQWPAVLNAEAGTQVSLRFGHSVTSTRIAGCSGFEECVPFVQFLMLWQVRGLAFTR